MFNTLRLAALLAVCAAFSNPVLAAPPGVIALGSPDRGAATAKSTLPLGRLTAIKSVVDADAAGREPFQAQVLLTIANPVAAISIPAGKRLIVEEINIAGDAFSSTGPIQPIVLAYASVAGSAQADLYYAVNQSSTVAGQFFADLPVKVYADSLQLGLGFAGYTPTSLGMNATVSGHLISEAIP